MPTVIPSLKCTIQLKAYKSATQEKPYVYAGARLKKYLLY